MSRGSSPLHDSMVFVVGARRSGTMWLQRAICTHPDVFGVPSETHLFSHGIAPLAALFQHASPGSIAVASTYMDRTEFLDAVRDFCDKVFGDLRAALQPQAKLIVERTPWHGRVLELIRDVYPDAAVLHIIRDGRDVTRSLLKRHWGPKTMDEAAEEWRSSVQLARTVAPTLAKYRECRYEELLADPQAQLKGIFEWLALPVTDDLMQATKLEMDTPVNLIGGESSVGAGKWREALDSEQIAVFDRIAGPLLVELGYDGEQAMTVTPGGETQVIDVPPPASPHVGLGIKARRRVRSRWRRSAPASRPVQDTQRLFDRLLAHVVGAESGSMRTLFEPTAEIRVVNGADDRKRRGEAALLRLEEQIAADRSEAGKLLRSDVHPTGVIVTGVLVHASASGNEMHRVLVARMTADRITALTYYRLRQPAALTPQPLP